MLCNTLIELMEVVKSIYCISHEGSHGSNACNAPPEFLSRLILEGVPIALQEPKKNPMEDLLAALT